MKFIAALFLLNFGLPMTDFTGPKGWRGIVPLHSTKADVERLFNSSSAEYECVLSACTYYLRDANVQFNYSLGDCRSGQGVWDVPADTVLWITVNPKPRTPLSALGIDEKDFEKKKMGHIEGTLYYVNENEGLTLEVYDGLVQVFLYGPSRNDERLRCK